ncbi:hypothetical protein AB8Z38_23515 [Bradyrhizobium sp. LLZ17]|uniref:Uncharacterized protein n=1 Tax=Bradyrhizobium sp. LLZ17 TaxID=3239388 RepID=A0AB39XE89_9BRAD
MKKIASIFAVVSFVGFLVWQIPQYLETQRRERELLLEQQKQAEAAKTAEAARKALEEKKQRDEGRAAVSQASDERLKSLVRDCRQKIGEKIATTGSKPSFAVYFPDYDADDLRNLTAMDSAMNASTGRPSVILNKDDHETRQIAALRRYPVEISIVAESASDTFSGVKRWAAEYRCTLDGLSVKTVTREGPLYFF